MCIMNKIKGMVQVLWLCSFTVLLQYILFFISMGNTHSTYNMLRFSQQCLIHNKSQAAYVAIFNFVQKQ